MGRFAILITIVAVALVGLVAGPALGSAQPGTPNAAEADTAASPVALRGELDLAAMAPSGDDVPAAFATTAEEHYFLPAGVSGWVYNGFVPAEEIAATGLSAYYRSYYFGESGDRGGTDLRVNVAEFDSPEAAEAAFDLLADQTVIPADVRGGVEPMDRSGVGIGEEPTETSVYTLDFTAFEGPRIDVVETTFRVDRVLATVAVEHYAFPDPAAAATPAADASPVASPEAMIAQDQQLLAEVAAVFQERIETVLSGAVPDGIEPALPGLLLPIDETWPWPGLVPEGYKDAAQILGEGALAEFAGEFQGGYSRTVSVGSASPDEGPLPPFVTLGVSEFASPEAALAVLEAARQAPDDLPPPGPTPPGIPRELIADPAIAAADAAFAFQSPTEEGGALDSAGVAFVVGSRLATVNVLSAPSVEDAIAAAEDLAAQQAVCLAAVGPCQALTVPAALQVATSATPVATPAGAIAGPLFANVTDAALPTPQPCGPGAAEGCYSNYVRLADLDGDGDLDIVFANGGGYFESGGEEGLQPLAIYRNDGPGEDGGATFTDVSAEAVGGFAGRLRQVAIGDVDADGDLDLYAPGSWGETDALWINDGAGLFADEAASRLPAGLASRAGATRFGDVDGDGDLDLVVTAWGETPPTSPGTAHLYLNDGAGVFAEESDRLPAPPDPPLGTAPVDVDFVDVDDDFDLDLILNNRDGRNLLWRNDGRGRFADATETDLPAKPSAMSYDVEPCDVDGDGDLDLWVDNAGAASAEQLLINDGAGHFADESRSRIVGNPPGDDNEVNCADVDGDGDLDAVIAALQGNDRVLINDGAGSFGAMRDAFPAREDPSLSMELGDLDGDAVLDAVTAQGESLPQLNRVYRGLAPMPADTRAPVVRRMPELTTAPAGAPIVVAFALSDIATSDGGPRLGADGAYVEWQTADGEPTRVAAVFVGGDLFRAVVPAQPEGTELTLVVGAVDQAGNELRAPLADAVTIGPAAEGTPEAGTPVS